MTSPAKPTVFAGRPDVTCFFLLLHMTGGLEDGGRDPQIPQVLQGPEVIASAIKKCDRERSLRVIPGSSALDRLVEGDDLEVTAKEFDLLDEVFQEHRAGVQANVYGNSSVIRQPLPDGEE